MPKEGLLDWYRKNEFCGDYNVQGHSCNLEVHHSDDMKQIAGEIAHDFKNIITGIVGNLSLAQVYLNDSHTSTQAIKRAEQASQRANALADKLMGISKSKSPYTSGKRVSIKRVIEECVAFTITDPRIRCFIYVDENCCDAAIDDCDLFQVLNNLITNSVQAMTNGGSITISSTMESLYPGNHHSIAVGEYIRIQLDDTGCGIPQELLGKIFDSYFTTKANGNGLGLSSVKNIVIANSGIIEVGSVSGKGTSVTLLIPAISK